MKNTSSLKNSPRVVLVNLPWSDNGRKGVRAGSRWPFTMAPENGGRLLYVPFPFYLATAASFLSGAGYDVLLIDAVAEGISEEEVFKRIVSFGPRLLVAETSTPSFLNDIKILRMIRENCRACRIALAGPHASVFAQEILEEYSFVEYVLMGEYEETLMELARHLAEGGDEELIPGLARRCGGKPKINPPRPLLEKLDILPWPERKTLPLYRYNDGFCGLPQPNVQMWTSRGCPFGCTFCLWPQVIYRGRKYRTRSVTDVVDEMAHLLREYHFKAVYFDDDVFNADRRHVLGFCREIKKRKISVPWAAMARADLMDEEVLSAMAESGLYAIKYGIESASEKILKAVNKDMDLDKTKKAIAETKNLGVKVHLTFCLGLPGETRRTIRETEDFIGEARPDSAQFSIATPFPGTAYYQSVEKDGMLLSRSWPDYDGGRKCVVRTQELSAADIEGIYENIRCHTSF